MKRAERGDLGKNRDAERRVREVLFDVGSHALEPSPVEFALASRRKLATKARREDVAIQLPDELVVLQPGAFAQGAQARSYASGNGPDDRIGAAVQVFETAACGTPISSAIACRTSGIAVTSTTSEGPGTTCQ
jgi:hypothetical protein